MLWVIGGLSAEIKQKTRICEGAEQIRASKQGYLKEKN